MRDRLEDIISRHDAATACGCSCCDDDYAAFVEQRRRDSQAEHPELDTTVPTSTASRRGSVRHVFETLLGAKKRKDS